MDTNKTPAAGLAPFTHFFYRSVNGMDYLIAGASPFYKLDLFS
jgi:hypothetical protein